MIWRCANNRIAKLCLNACLVEARQWGRAPACRLAGHDLWVD
jgi:hypothetical protein